LKTENVLNIKKEKERRVILWKLLIATYPNPFDVLSSVENLALTASTAIFVFSSACANSIRVAILRSLIIASSSSLVS
jgi:hypothetical protein